MTIESTVMRPDILTRVCLVVAALLPWYAMASGVVGLYFLYLLVNDNCDDTLRQLLWPLRVRCNLYVGKELHRCGNSAGRTPR